MRAALPLVCALACAPSEWPDGVDAFADQVVSFSPGDGAGFGADGFPDVVLGPPGSALGGGGSLDVLSLGREGEIVVAFADVVAVDGQGPDLIVFENPFPGWIETGEVAASADGITFLAWPCTEDGAGCAGVTPTEVTADNGIDPTDPEVAGGDAFDLAEIGLEVARFVRVRDTGWNAYDAPSGGFDLDAVAIANGVVE